MAPAVNMGFNTVQEKFKQMKSEDKLLINKLLGEISELKEDIVKVSQNNFHNCSAEALGCMHHIRL